MSLSDNLVAYWAFDGDFNDTIGSNHGEGLNTIFDAGKIKGCVNLNGSDSYCLVETNENIYLTQPFTYTFWINAPEAAIDSTYLDFNGEEGILITRNSADGKVTVTVGGSSSTLVSSQRIDDGSWNFICVVVSGSESKFYLNTMDITESCSISSNITYNNSSLYLGVSENGTVYTEAKFDEFGIWDSVLSETEISNLYNEGVGSSIGLKGGLYFDGTDDYAEVTVPTMTSGTMECWTELRGDLSGSYVGILELGSWGSNLGFGIWIDTPDRIGLHDSGNTHTYSVNNLFKNQSVHLAVVCDGIDLFLYLNGIQVKTISSATINGADLITIGKRADSSSEYFNGIISEIRVWNYPRTQQEIQDNMYFSPDVNDSGLIAYYNFTEDTGDFLLDYNNLNNGSIYGATFTKNVGWFYIHQNTFYNNIDTSDKGHVDIKALNLYSDVFLYTDGTDDYADVTVPTMTSGTMECWFEVRGDITGSHVGILELGKWGSNTGFGMWFDGPEIIGLHDSGRTHSYSSIAIEHFRKYHIAAVYDSIDIFLYLDGGHIHTISSANVNSSDLITIGKRADSSSEYFNGFIEDIRVWGYPRTQQEIQDNMNSELTGDENGLVAYYKVLGKYNSILKDCSVNNNDATIYGAVIYRVRNFKESILSIEDPFTFNTISGSSLNLDFVPDEKCTVSGVVIDGESVQLPEDEPYTSHTIESVEENHDIHVDFRDLYQFTIEAVSGEHGSITPSGVLTYYEFETPTFEFDWYEGYRLKQYYVDEVPKGNNDLSYTFSNLIDDYQINVVYGVYDDIKGIVVTTESIELDNTGATLVSGSLTKGQDYTNCVPFISHAGGDSYQYRHLTDVYFEEGKVFAEKGSPSSSDSVIYINVIEFNPVNVRVTQGDFSFSDAEHNVTVSGVDLDSAFLIFTYNSSSSDNNWPNHNVKGRIENSDNIEFIREGTSGDINGHYYLVEALNGEFKVQHFEQSLTSTADRMEIPEEIEAHRTFFISSSSCTYSSPHSNRSCVNPMIYSNKELYSSRDYDSGTIYVNTQIVEFSETGKVFVHHVSSKFIENDVSGYVGNFSTTLYGSKVVVFNCNGNQPVKTTGTYSNSIPNTFLMVKRIDNDTYNIVKKTTGEHNYLSLQFIDWDGYSFDYSNSVSEDISDLVKSVEYINTVFSSDTDEYYKYLPLSKNQNWKYCVPFCTYTANSSNHGDIKCDINISEGPILTIYRSIGQNVDCDINLYVVEFKENETFVEKNSFFSFGDEDSVTISGTTSSGVQDLYRSIIQFTQAVSYGSSNWDSFNIRGEFFDNSSLIFHRSGTGGGMFGHYYLVEFLNDFVYTNQTQLSISNVTSRWNILPGSEEEDVWHLFNTIPIVSYYSNLTNEHADRHTLLYNHQFPQSGYVSKEDDNGTIYANLLLLKIKNKFLVQKVYYSMAGGVVEGSVDLEEVVNYNTSVVLNSNQLSTGRSEDTFSDSIPSAYITVWLSEDGTKVNYKRSSDRAVNNGYLYVIDFSKDYFYSGIYRKFPKSFLHSIENTKFNASGSYGKIDLGKKQNPSVCVPFISTEFSSTDRLDRMNYMTDIIGDRVYFYRQGVGEDHPINLYVLEFNPNRVKVQKRYFTISTNVYDVNINPVNMNKSFIIITYSGDGSYYYARVDTRATFVDNETVRVERGSSTNNVWGVFYVVEALDNSFEVTHLDGYLSGTSLDLYLDNLFDTKDTCLLVNYYSTNAADRSDRSTCGVFLVMIIKN